MWYKDHHLEPEAAQLHQLYLHPHPLTGQSSSLGTLKGLVRLITVLKGQRPIPRNPLSGGLCTERDVSVPLSPHTRHCMRVQSVCVLSVIRKFYIYMCICFDEFWNICFYVCVAVCVLASLHVGLYEKCHFAANWNRTTTPIFEKQGEKEVWGFGHWLRRFQLLVLKCR